MFACAGIQGASGWAPRGTQPPARRPRCRWGHGQLGPPTPAQPREDCAPGFFLQMRKPQPGGVSPLPLLTQLDGSSSDLGPKVWIPEPTRGSEHRALGDVRGDAKGKRLHLSRSSEGGKNVLGLTHSQLNRKEGTMRGRGGCDGAVQAEEGPTSLQR